MKRVIEAGGDEKYPNFTTLYLSLNEQFYERVVSHIPGEVWASVFYYISQSDEVIKYSHYWIKLTRVSKLFRTTVYEGMVDIYINVDRFKNTNPSAVLDRFKKLETLRVPCFDDDLILPKMPCLKKLKVRNTKKSQCKPHDDGGVCGGDPSLSQLDPKNLPLLESLSIKHCCIDWTCDEKPPAILGQLTKLVSNTYFDMIEKSDLPSLTELDITACGSSSYRITRHKKLKKIWVNSGFHNFGNYAGECVIRYHRDHYFRGQMIGGRKEGLWKQYNCNKVVFGSAFYEKGVIVNKC
jgi:hypothetical protein